MAAHNGPHPGRPRKERKCPKSPAEFAEHLGSLGVPAEQVAERLGICYETFRVDKQLSVAWKKGLARTCEWLRSVQLQTAKKVPVMQIWLGKQMLGQRDRNEITGADGGPITLAWAGEEPPWSKKRT